MKYRVSVRNVSSRAARGLQILLLFNGDPGTEIRVKSSVLQRNGFPDEPISASTNQRGSATFISPYFDIESGEEMNIKVVLILPSLNYRGTIHFARLFWGAADFSKGRVSVDNFTSVVPAELTTTTPATTTTPTPWSGTTPQQATSIELVIQEEFPVVATADEELIYRVSVRNVSSKTASVVNIILMFTPDPEILMTVKSSILQRNGFTDQTVNYSEDKMLVFVNTGRALKFLRPDEEAIIKVVLAIQSPSYAGSIKLDRTLAEYGKFKANPKAIHYKSRPCGALIMVTEPPNSVTQTP